MGLSHFRLDNAFNWNKKESAVSVNYNSILSDNDNGSINGDRHRSVSLSMSHYTELTPGVESQKRKEITVSTISTVSSAGAIELYKDYSDAYQEVKETIGKDPCLTELCCKIQSCLACGSCSALSFFGMIWILMNSLLPLDQRYHDFVHDLVDENCIPNAKDFLDDYCYPNTTDSEVEGWWNYLNLSSITIQIPVIT